MAGSRKRKNQKDPVDEFTREIILLIILALSIILFISNFGVGGFVGNAVSSFLFGLFGIPAYLFPILLFWASIFLISNLKNPRAHKKLIAALIGFMLLCALMQLLTEGYLHTSSLFDFYRDCALYHTGGGIVGGIVCKAFATAFGVAGAYVLIIVGLISSLIIVTQRSFFGFFRKQFRNIRVSIKKWQENREMTRPEREARAEEREEARAQRASKREEKRRIKQERRQPQRERTGRRAERGSTSNEGGFLAGSQLFVPEEKSREKEESGKPQDDFVIQRSENVEEPELSEEPDRTAEEVNVSQGEKSGEKSFSNSRNPRSSQQEIASGVENIKKEMVHQAAEKKRAYSFPPFSLLHKGKRGNTGDSDAHLRETAKKLQETLHNFGVNVTIVNVSCGPTVTRYELQPEQGVKVSKIVGLTDDIKLNLAAADIRIEAPIPGKAAVGIEVPNKENSEVMLRDILQSREFQSSKSKLSFAAGKDIAGRPVVADIGKMPHLLIAGATGSGKSVCINTLIMSLLYKATPEEVKLIMIDPKVVELSVYNGIPHLLIPVVTDPKKAAGALNWAVAEMTDRYNTFAEFNVRNLEDYNDKISRMTFGENETIPQPLPQIVIIVDELADLMMVAPGEVEDAICRLAQLARAAGIHLVIATQRPSVNVITGLIKANMPSRIAFSVSSGVDSRTILDMNGAEKLLGKGDMLFYPQGYQKPARLQGAFVSDSEVSAVVDFLANKNPSQGYSDEIQNKINASGITQGNDSAGERDAYFVDAGKFIIEKDKASIGMLQRVFKVGFNRAARIMDQLSVAGVVGPEEGTKPRKVLMTMEEFEAYIEEL